MLTDRVAKLHVTHSTLHVSFCNMAAAYLRVGLPQEALDAASRAATLAEHAARKDPQVKSDSCKKKDDLADSLIQPVVWTKLSSSASFSYTLDCDADDRYGHPFAHPSIHPIIHQHIHPSTHKPTHPSVDPQCIHPTITAMHPSFQHPNILRDATADSCRWQEPW